MDFTRIAAWLRRPPPYPGNIEFERPPRRGSVDLAPHELVKCPRCDNRVPVDLPVCRACGFPFICDTAEVDTKRLARRTQSWRTVLGVAVLLFMLTNAVFVTSGSDAYQGLTSGVAANMVADELSGIPISGPDSFVSRTELALGLLKERAPDFYMRMREGVKNIDFLEESYLESQGGRITLEGIGAVSTPATGRVQVLFATAFPSGAQEYNDFDLFSYTGVLIHELRHIELHKMGQSMGGWEEEVECERAAYEALKHMQAPGAVLQRYTLYLSDPQHRRYQGWYDWYKQQE
jgi:hypothetical protein